MAPLWHGPKQPESNGYPLAIDVKASWIRIMPEGCPGLAVNLQRVVRDAGPCSIVI